VVHEDVIVDNIVPGNYIQDSSDIEENGLSYYQIQQLNINIHKHAQKLVHH
jgi:hypothetical protein